MPIGHVPGPSATTTRDTSRRGTEDSSGARPSAPSPSEGDSLGARVARPRPADALPPPEFLLAGPTRSTDPTTPRASGSSAEGRAASPGPRHYLLDTPTGHRLRGLDLVSSSRRRFEPASIAVLGGGLTGVISALKLANAGHKVTLFERNSDLCGEASKIPAHLYGAPGYCHLPVEEQLEILDAGLEFARMFPQAINPRPTVMALRTNDRVLMVGEERFRTVDDLVASGRRAGARFAEVLERAPQLSAFGRPEEYFQEYTRADIEHLRAQPLVQSPRTNDEWMANFARELHPGVLDQLQFPVCLVREFGINMTRFRELAREALTSAGVDVKLGAGVSDVQSKAKTPGIEVEGVRFDFALNCAGAESGALDDRRGAPSHRSVIVKGAGVAEMFGAIESLPQMYIMGRPMVHLTPYEGGAAVVNVTSKTCTYVENGEIPSPPGQSQPVIPAHLKKIMGSAGKSEELGRTARMIDRVAEILPRMLGGAPIAFLGGDVTIPGRGDFERRGGGWVSVTEEAATLIAPKATTAVGVDVARRVAAASRFRVPLSVSEQTAPVALPEDQLSLAAERAAQSRELHPGLARVFGGEGPRAGSSANPQEASGHGRMLTYLGGARERHLVLGTSDYVEKKTLGRGFGGEAFLYEDPTTGHNIVVKKYFKLRSQAFPGDMEDATHLPAEKREHLRKIQEDDFHVERSAFEAVAAQAAHPNVSHALSFGLVEDRLAIVLPYHDGGSVRDLVRALDHAERAGQMTPEERSLVGLFVTRETLSGLAHLESILVHRDLKPDNILLDRPRHDDGTRGIVPKIADFGTSTTELHPTVPVVTTPQYKSPEYVQAEAEGQGPHDHGQDVWSTGITLHELAFGGRPFDGALPRDEAAIYDQIQAHARGRGPGIRSGDHSPTAELVRRMTRPHPERPSARRLLEDPAFQVPGIDQAPSLINKVMDRDE